MVTVPAWLAPPQSGHVPLQIGPHSPPTRPSSSPLTCVYLLLYKLLYKHCKSAARELQIQMLFSYISLPYRPFSFPFLYFVLLFVYSRFLFFSSLLLEHICCRLEPVCKFEYISVKNGAPMNFERDVH